MSRRAVVLAAGLTALVLFSVLTGACAALLLAGLL